jgi:hypothetical protein
MTQQRNLTTNCDYVTGGKEPDSIRLLAYPHLDVAEIPLRLPPPSSLECGGYMIASAYQYSPIDLLVAGLSALRLGLYIYSLNDFFNTYQSPSLVEHEIYLTYRINRDVYTSNIAYIKTQNYRPLVKVLHYHAPFTFGGVF